MLGAASSPVQVRLGVELLLSSPQQGVAEHREAPDRNPVPRTKTNMGCPGRICFLGFSGCDGGGRRAIHGGRAKVGPNHVVVGAPRHIVGQAAAEAHVPCRRHQVAHGHLRENGLVRRCRRTHPLGVRLGVRKLVEEAVDLGRIQTCVVVAPIAAEEGVEEPLGIAGRQRVLGPHQQVKVLVRHNLVQRVPTATVSHDRVHRDAQAGQRRLDHGLHQHEAWALGIGYEVQGQLNTILHAVARSVLRPPCCIQETLRCAFVTIGLGLI
mmetsp:Transcript_62798/g.162941  ORF Transcript_62798/g.162941 Transcript_62798/m.162941 type:complete len:267 (+) Transcript_62798:304-1104(+)